MSHAAICLVILAVVIGLFVWNRLPVEVLALGSGLALLATGALTVDQVFAGSAQPGHRPGVRVAGADVPGCSRRRGPAHPRRHRGQHDGDGAGRVGAMAVVPLAWPL
ncbi:di/tricarboxylate transporter [Streptacidiphilus sp. MAP12-20]|uniref:hypothetical protein n=1 Tax=Streptacidiphilus sp. MAP12-20 TaxID=3156299 RepID=UPI0035147ABB